MCVCVCVRVCVCVCACACAYGVCLCVCVLCDTVVRHLTVLLHVDTVMHVCVSDISIDMPVTVSTLYFSILTL